MFMQQIQKEWLIGERDLRSRKRDKFNMATARSLICQWIMRSMTQFEMKKILSCLFQKEARNEFIKFFDVLKMFLTSIENKI